MVYIVRVIQYGKVVREERVGSMDAAKSVRDDWQRRGFQVQITDDRNTSYGV